MINKETFKTIIAENQEVVSEIELIERPAEYEENGNYVLMGLRQAGKSYLLYQKFQQFLKEGTPISQLVYINFDDDRLSKMEVEDFDVILQAYSEMYSDKPILFFDEIQNVDGWEHFARRLANQKYRVFITGSNAKMLSKEIATVLGGRYWEKMVYTYTFSEYLNAVGVKLDKNWKYGKMKSEAARHFNDYFHFGGFPDIVTTKAKRAWLNNIYRKIFFNDIIVRNGVRSEEALRMVVRRLAESVKQPTSYTRLANLIKSTGINISVSTIIDYIRFLKESCMIFPLENYATKFVEKETNKKYYFADNGLLNIFLMDAETSLLENLCAIHLLQKYGDELYFYNQNIEVDFFVPSEGIAVQASYDIDMLDTLERETKALVKLDDMLTKTEGTCLKRMIIVTREQERVIELKDGRKIEVVAIGDWVLE